MSILEKATPAAQQVTASPQTWATMKSVPRRAAPAALILVVATLWITVFADGNHVYLYCTALLASMGALALGLLMGTAGQISIGNAAFLAIGAFSGMAANRAGLAFPLDVGTAVIVAAVAGVLVGLPALRIQGLYLALATLAAHFIVVYICTEYQKAAVGSVGFLTIPALSGNGLDQQQRTWAWLLTGVVVVCLVGVAAIQRGRIGRLLGFMREHETVAPCLGIDVRHCKLMVFVVTSAVIGLQGALMPYFSGTLSVETFTLDLAIVYIAMIMIGGTGNLFGPVIGAFVVITMPSLIPDLLAKFTVAENVAVYAPSVSLICYGLLIIVMITQSNDGISGWLTRVAGFSRRFTRLSSTKG